MEFFNRKVSCHSFWQKYWSRINYTNGVIVSANLDVEFDQAEVHFW